MKQAQIPPRRNVPPATEPYIRVEVRGNGRAIAKTLLAEYLGRVLRDWSPKGIKRPMVHVVDGERRICIDFHPNADDAAQVEIADTMIDCAWERFTGNGALQILSEKDSIAKELFAMELRQAVRQGAKMADRHHAKVRKQTPPIVRADETEAVVAVRNGYEVLWAVLAEALDQAQRGKGAERHNLGGDLPFERQRMQQISELIGSVDGMSYQACKKITEGVKLPTLDRQVAELLGAVNYICGIVIFLRKQHEENHRSQSSES